MNIINLIHLIRHKLHPLRLYLHYEPQRLLLFFYHFIPVKKTKLVFSNFSGKRCGDSPYAIFAYLQKKHPEWDFVWLSSPYYNPKIPEGARSVPWRMKSSKMIYELATSSVWIESHLKPVYVSKRANQLFIQTWHGGISLKSDKMKAVSIDENEKQKRFLSFGKLPDYVISDSKFTTENFKVNFFAKENCIEIGAPCDDIFFSNIDKNKIKEELKIPKEKKIVLYCPTWRDSGDVSCYNFDIDKLLSVLNKKFKDDWILLSRLHPLVMNEHHDLFKADNKKIFDVTKNEVINELLYIADILITDYSGVMGTYMNTGRPIFLYQTDYEQYLNERGISFTTDELPFPVSNNEEELFSSILNFDAPVYDKKIKKFKSKLGFVENNNATEKICKIIENFINTGRKEL